MEVIVTERLNAYTSFNSFISKAINAFEGFENSKGSLKLAVDAFSVVTEQVRV